MADTQKHIVIIGAGFGGLFCARSLVNSSAQITLIDRQNHHLFQPLLYQVATGFLGINDVALPIRSLFQKSQNMRVVMSEVTGIDMQHKQVITADAHYPYDYLIIATGSQYHFFGNQHWAPYVNVLKSLEDAIQLRQQILSSFEEAERQQQEEHRRTWLTYVVIGGGPTGVEMAGAIADVVNYSLSREFKKIRPQHTSIILLEAGERLLSGMPENLSAYTHKELQKKGVTIHCNTPVQDIGDGYVMTNTGRINCRIIIWAAGVKPTPVAEWLNITPDRRGGVNVNDDLSVKGLQDIYVIGDAATFMQDGKPLPALASVAKQQGKYLAKALKARMAGKTPKPFRYRDWGTMATIGRNEAAADFGKFTVTGWIGWVLWGIVHIYFLTGFRNRIVVFLTWIWTYLTFGMGSRIIVNMNDKFNKSREIHYD